MKVAINPKEIPDRVIRTLAPVVMECVEDYFKDPATIRKFIEWHKKRYNRLPSNIDSLNATLGAGAAI